MQSIECCSIVARAGGARTRSLGGVRESVQPCVQIVEGSAVAALVILDPFDQPAQQALDRVLFHGALRMGRTAGPCGPTPLPTSFRNHPVPHGATPPPRVWSRTGPVKTRDARSKRALQVRVNF